MNNIPIMKPKRIIVAVLVISALLLQGVTHGQPQKMKKADEAALYYQYARAVPLLEKVIAKDNKYKTQAQVLLARCHMYMNHMESAQEVYAQVIDNPGIDPDNHYFYGQVLRTMGKYDLAREQFLIYDSLAPENIRGKMFAAYCDSMAAWKNFQPSGTIANVGVLNSTKADFSPIFFDNGIVFTSDRLFGKDHPEVYHWTGAPYLDLYMVTVNDSARRLKLDSSSIHPFSSVINQKYHDGPASFSKNGDIIYFTRTISEKVKNLRKDKERIYTHILKIFSSSLMEGIWSDPEPFYLNDSVFSVGHPSLSGDGMQLYFTSDMPGGYGGTDLYVCHKEGEEWGPARNLGRTINTLGDEMFPYILDSALYFSSTGHLGYGGLDLFKSKMGSAEWGKPVNLLAPLNSSYDDFGISLSPDRKTGYLSSNRPGGQGGDDIYSFTVIEPVIPKPNILAGYVVECSTGAYLTGLVKEKQTLQPIAGATVFAFNKNTQSILIAKTDASGRYTIDVEGKTGYVVKAMKDGYLSDCYSMMMNNRPQSGRDLLLDKFEVNEVFKLENIYYDLDKWNIRPDAAAELDKLVMIMKENPITIELSSHTDCRASNEYNDKLSQRRAESAVKYVASKGISSERMIAKGYGETQLVNGCRDGVKCTEAEHQQNRRTEFRILEITRQPTSLFQPLERFIAGETHPRSRFDKEFFANCSGYSGTGSGLAEIPAKCAKPLSNATVFLLNTKTNKVTILKTDDQGRYETETEPDIEYVIKARKEGYLADCITARSGSESVLVEDLALTKYSLQQVFEVENIYYDLDKWDIRPDAEPSLNELVRIMKDNPITIELGSHTDCRASDKYNMELSQKRAESAVRYIVFNGVDPARITARGYGESQLVNRCDDGVKCTEEEHQMNRRTEFKITGSWQDNSPAMESLDKFVAGAVYEKGYFDRDYFNGCPLKSIIATGDKAGEKRVWEEYAKTVQIPVTQAAPPQPAVPPAVQPSETKKEVTKPAPATPPAAETGKKSATSGMYTVQIAAGKSISKSVFKGVPNVKRCLGKDGLYRFTVGEFSTRQEADVLKNQLKSQGYPEAWVVKIDENRVDCD
jgi:outer membrane protein OmpA-like peptidoglycan-associated protein/tetratricopeptide (TPR) repeat protein